MPDEQQQRAPPPIEPVTVPLRSRRRERAQVAQKIQHLIPASGLLFAGMQALRDGAHGAELGLAVIEIVTSAALVFSFARHVKAARRPHVSPHERHGVDWFDIFAAGMLFAEALEHWHLKHHVARPVILTALVTLALGLLHGRITAAVARHRVLHVDERGVRVGGKFWRTFTARWGEIAAITVTDRSAEIRTWTGRTRRLALTDLEDAPAVRAALVDARAHLGTLQQLTTEKRS